MIRSITFILFLCVSSGSFFRVQAQDNLTDSQSVQEEFQNLKQNQSDEVEYYPWKNPLLVQLELLLPKISDSLGRLDSKISKLAVVDFSFDPSIQESTAKIIRSKIYGTILYNNPSLQLINCIKCSQVRSSLKDGILRISRGVANSEERLSLAKELDVEAFLSGVFTVQEERLIVSLEVVDSDGGRIVLSDVFTSNSPTPAKYYSDIFFGQIYHPVKFEDARIGDVNLTSLYFGGELFRKFTENAGYSYRNYLFFGVENQIKDTSSTTGESKQFNIYGINFEGTIFRHFNFVGNSFIFSAGGGLGQSVISIGNKFILPVYFKTEMKFIFSNEFIVGIETNHFQSYELSKVDDNDNNISLPGIAYGIYAGYQF